MLMELNLDVNAASTSLRQEYSGTAAPLVDEQIRSLLSTAHGGGGSLYTTRDMTLTLNDNGCGVKVRRLSAHETMGPAFRLIAYEIMGSATRTLNMVGQGLKMWARKNIYGSANRIWVCKNRGKVGVTKRWARINLVVMMQVVLVECLTNRNNYFHLFSYRGFEGGAAGGSHILELCIFADSERDCYWRSMQKYVGADIT
ncbi:hypothetical protein E3N88_28912 [Mikania micrantha]|uniref:Uncharacterized protein n=1 Tax=Mikania micrantha TaxID=192012 RepID=A0A5N6N1D4_9ASTR|nr:hypothetical protein E3N88_28912 [Mikania micrantha]